MKCPICQSVRIKNLLSIKEVPVICNLQYSSANDARRAPKWDIRLGSCQECSHIYNTDFDPNLVRYNQDYLNHLHHSPHFQKYSEGLANHLIERYELMNRDIIEIGCGDGYFTFMAKNKFKECYGVDISSLRLEQAIKHLKKKPDTKNIHFYKCDVDKGLPFKDSFFDTVCCIAILEHVFNPPKVIEEINRVD